MTRLLPVCEFIGVSTQTDCIAFATYPNKYNSNIVTKFWSVASVMPSLLRQSQIYSARLVWQEVSGVNYTQEEDLEIPHVEVNNPPFATVSTCISYFKHFRNVKKQDWAKNRSSHQGWVQFVIQSDTVNALVYFFSCRSGLKLICFLLWFLNPKKKSLYPICIFPFCSDLKNDYHQIFYRWTLSNFFFFFRLTMSHPYKL